MPEKADAKKRKSKRENPENMEKVEKLETSNYNEKNRTISDLIITL